MNIEKMYQYLMLQRFNMVKANSSKVYSSMSDKKSHKHKLKDLQFKLFFLKRFKFFYLTGKIYSFYQMNEMSKRVNLRIYGIYLIEYR